MSYTKGKWYVVEGFTDSAISTQPESYHEMKQKNKIIEYYDNEVLTGTEYLSVTEDNLKRIVSCVNAMQGINKPEAIPLLLDMVYNAAIMAQNNTLPKETLWAAKELIDKLRGNDEDRI